MEWLVRLRIGLADTPGALARVAALIAGEGGNITSVDVHHDHSGDGTTVIDDVVVAFAERVDLAGLRDRFATAGAGTLLSHQEAYRTDPVVAALRSAESALRSRHDDTALVRGVTELASSPAVWISTNEEAAQWEAGRLALDRGLAVAVAADLPEEMAARLPGDAWLLASPVGDGLRVLFVGRLQSNPFTNTEVARIEALLGLYATARA